MPARQMFAPLSGRISRQCYCVTIRDIWLNFCFDFLNIFRRGEGINVGVIVNMWN